MSARSHADCHWFFTHFPKDLGDLPCTMDIPDPGLAHHIGHVMRLKPGEGLILVDEELKTPYLCLLEVVGKKQVSVSVVKVYDQGKAAVQPVSVVAAVSLIKGQRWDWMLQKLTELGVSRIIPLKTRRCIVDIKDPASKCERWREIVKHAAEQSERVDIPILEHAWPLEQLCDWTREQAVLPALVASEHGGLLLRKVMEEIRLASGTVVFAIGPEGGWEEEEIDLLQMGHFQTVSLGDKLLRSETAALYMATVLDYVVNQNPGPNFHS